MLEINFSIRPTFLDLFAITNDMGRIKTAEALHSVRAIDDNVVHVHEPNLGLQASLVRCIGWRYDWTSRCHACGKYPPSPLIVRIFLHMKTLNQ